MPLEIYQVSTTGLVVSKIIVSVRSLVVFQNESLNLIYTVFVSSPADKVWAIETLQLVRFVGLAVLPYATCSPPTPASVAHAVVKRTLVEFVDVASALILKFPPAGAVASKI